MPFIAIDFEASCLPQLGRSFPVEVGVADASGWSRSWLIRPHESWSAWEWRAEAEALHGISRSRLEREGLDVTVVAAQLRSAVEGSTLLADSYFDDGWCRALFDAAGEGAHPPVRCLAELQAFHDVDPTALNRALVRADGLRIHRHRAEDDARWSARVMSEIGVERDRVFSQARAA